MNINDMWGRLAQHQPCRCPPKHGLETVRRRRGNPRKGEGMNNNVCNAWAQLRQVAELIDPPASIPNAVVCLIWLLTRNDKRASVKHYLADASCGESTAIRIMNHMRLHGWADAKPLETDRRVVRLYPSKKLQGAINGL